MKRVLLGLALLACEALSRQYKPAAVAEANLGASLAKQEKYRL
jgi:hypothetical protein